MIRTARKSSRSSQKPADDSSRGTSVAIHIILDAGTTALNSRASRSMLVKQLDAQQFLHYYRGYIFTHYTYMHYHHIPSLCNNNLITQLFDPVRDSKPPISILICSRKDNRVFSVYSKLPVSFRCFSASCLCSSERPRPSRRSCKMARSWRLFLFDFSA
jgi:hypothetical protein